MKFERDIIRNMKTTIADKVLVKSSAHRFGFTLIEISIVLVIIGLIVGGVLVGKDLIRAAELRSVDSQLSEFKAAVNTFKMKYNCLPGDCGSATDFFGTALDCAAEQVSLATCNGNGDGILSTAEGLLFWKHLSNSGLIPGNYTGVQDGANPYATSVRNVPSGKISGSLWNTVYWGVVSGESTLFDGVYNNTLQFGRYQQDNNPANPVITSKEAMLLDQKIDDGKPGTGKMRMRILGTCSVKSDGVTPATSTDGNISVYNVNANGDQCILWFPSIW